MVTDTEMFFYFCFGFNDLIFRLIYINSTWFTGNGFWLYLVIIVIIAIASSALVTVVALQAKKGRSKWLWGGLIGMIIDTLFILPCYFFAEESETSLWFMFVFHMVILVAIAMAIFMYYKIIDLAKKYGMLDFQSNQNSSEPILEGEKDDTLEK